MLDLVFASSLSLITEPVECPILFETDHTVLFFYFNLTLSVKYQGLCTILKSLTLVNYVASFLMGRYIMTCAYLVTLTKHGLNGMSVLMTW